MCVSRNNRACTVCARHAHNNNHDNAIITTRGATRCANRKQKKCEKPSSKWSNDFPGSFRTFFDSILPRATPSGSFSAQYYDRAGFFAAVPCSVLVAFSAAKMPQSARQMACAPSRPSGPLFVREKPCAHGEIVFTHKNTHRTPGTHRARRVGGEIPVRDQNRAHARMFLRVYSRVGWTV